MVNPLHHPNSRSARGFSLIELLVTLAVVAILSSLLFPAFGGVRGMAMRLMCQNNMRAIYAGIDALQRDSKYAKKYTLESRYADPDQLRPQELMALSFYDEASGVTEWDGIGKLGMGNNIYLDSKEIYFCPAHNTMHTIENQGQNFAAEIQIPIPGNTVYSNYHYWSDWNNRVASKDAASKNGRLKLQDVVLTDGLRTKRDLTHKNGVNALGDDGRVFWMGDSELLQALAKLPDAQDELSKPDQQKTFDKIIAAIGKPIS